MSVCPEARCACGARRSGASARSCLDFLRVLRAVVVSRNQSWDLLSVLDVVDQRTLTQLLERGSVPPAVSQGRPSVHDFLTRQRYIRDERLVQAVARQMTNATNGVVRSVRIAPTTSGTASATTTTRFRREMATSQRISVQPRTRCRTSSAAPAVTTLTPSAIPRAITAWPPACRRNLHTSSNIGIAAHVLDQTHAPPSDVVPAPRPPGPPGRAARS